MNVDMNMAVQIHISYFIQSYWSILHTNRENEQIIYKDVKIHDLAT